MANKYKYQSYQHRTPKHTKLSKVDVGVIIGLFLCACLYIGFVAMAVLP